MTPAFRTDLRRTIRRSLPRFISIAALMMVGVFSLVGLKATGPDMRATADELYDRANLADVTVTSVLGLDQGDRDLIASSPGVRAVQFGHAEDVLLAGSDTTVRVMSTPVDEGDSALSRPIVTSGRLPETTHEIALDTRLGDHHAIGDAITVERPLTADEQALADLNLDGVAVGDLLSEHTFTVVGFIDSAEYINTDQLGQTPIGTGTLDAVAYVLPDTFTTDLPQIARLSFADTAGLAPYDQTYLDRLDAHRNALVDRVAQRPEQRRAALVERPQADIDRQRADLAAAQAQLEDARQQLAAAQAQLDSVPAAMNPGHDEQSAALAAQKARLDDMQAQLEDQAAQLDQAQHDVDALTVPAYSVADRRDNPGYQTYGDFADRIDIMGNVFPVLLFAVALLVSVTTMTRMVEEERTTSGTYAALGHSPGSIITKYVIYGFTASFIGAVLGVVLGHLILPPIVFGAYAAGFIFPNLIGSFHLWLSLIAVGIAAASTTLISAVVARRELTEQPADLLRPKAPKPGTRILLERVTPLWRRMSFLQKVTARNLFRYKARALMTILGVAGCSALLIAGIGLRDSITGVVGAQYDQITRYDLIALDQENSDGQGSQGSNLGGTAAGSSVTGDVIAKVAGVASSDHVRFERMTTRGGANDTKQPVNLMAPAPGQSGFGDFIHLTDSRTGQPLNPGDLGKDVVISQKLSDLLGVGPGEDLTLTDTNGAEHAMRVGAVADMYVEHYVFLSDAAYASVFGHDPQPNAWLIGLTPGHAGSSSSMSGDGSANSVAAALMNVDGVASVIKVSSVSSLISATLDGLNVVMLVLVVVALVLAMVVTFNLTNINVSERIRELCTIKVLGFYPLEVTMYVYRETLALTVVGILAGWGLGAWLHSFMITILPPDNVMLDPPLHAANIVASAAATLLISAGVMAVMHVRLRNIDMLDALKSVE